MLAWFGELSGKERRTMGACFGGWALDAFDVQMYSFVIPTVIALWGLSRGEAGLDPPTADRRGTGCGRARAATPWHGSARLVPAAILSM